MTRQQATTEDSRDDVVLLSIDRRHASAILVEETKAWEYRTASPEREPPYRVLLYATAPTKAIVGECRVVERLSGAPDAIVDATVDETPHDREDVLEYVGSAGSVTALGVRDPERYDEWVDLDELREVGIDAPPNFCYVDPRDVPGVDPVAIADGGSDAGEALKQMSDKFTDRSDIIVDGVDAVVTRGPPVTGNEVSLVLHPMDEQNDEIVVGFDGDRYEEFVDRATSISQREWSAGGDET